MTQKIPNTNEYIIALNRAVYGALKKLSTKKPAQ